MDGFEVVYFFRVFVLCNLVDVEVFGCSDFEQTQNIFVDGDVFVFEGNGVVVGELIEEFFKGEELLDGELELFSDGEGLAEDIAFLVLV